ncbi:MAG: methyl-accepting chemotaxis protein [Nitrospinae bacterium]|nr:methyl-accepting chemotaxis protein [Nitrospinota bacterium]
MKNMKLSVKLLINNIIVIVFMLMLAGVGIWGLANVKETAEILINEHSLALKEVGELNANLNGVRVALVTMFVKEDPADRAKLKETIKKLTENIEATFTRLRSAEKFPEDMIQDVKNIYAVWEPFRNTRDTELIPLIEAGKIEEAKKIAFGIQAERFNKYRELALAFAEKEKKEADEENAKFNYITSISKTLLIIMLAAGIIIPFAIGRFISNSITKPLNQVMTVLEKISQGDMRQKVELDSTEEIGTLARYTNTLVAELHKIMSRIAETAQSVASASQQVSATSGEMSRTLSVQSGQTTNVVASMEEMSATVTEVAKNSSQASDSARLAMETAESGGNIVQEGINSTNNIAKRVLESTKTVEELGASSQRIGEIVSVIDDIADQTNLLALNAAIEAARAGEQGRGFAVVADEVRKLAERTTKATKEIADMIKTIQKNTEEAVQSMEAGRKEVESGVEG